MSLVYDGRQLPAAPGQTALEALLAAGVEIGHSCRAGACRSCLVRAAEGAPPAASQVGLPPTLAAQGYLLACLCPAAEAPPLLPPDAAHELRATVVGKRQLEGAVVQLLLEPERELDYLPGQFVNLVRDDGLSRSYSLASLPTDPALELHVRVIEGGAMSGWIDRELESGQSLTLRGPHGSCCYVPGAPEQPLLLAGTGTGLAPLLGIARAAREHGHSGPIELWHGARDASGLYAHAALDALAAASNVRVTRCLLEGEPAEGYAIGPLDATLAAAHPKLDGWRVFLCGDPTLVKTMQRNSFMAGADLGAIHADAFVPTAPSGGVKA